MDTFGQRLLPYVPMTYGEEPVQANKEYRTVVIAGFCTISVNSCREVHLVVWI
jgi:hypothetical protein